MTVQATRGRQGTARRSLGVVSWLALLIAAIRPCAGAVLYVSNERGGNVSVVDTKTEKVISTWNVGKRPRGIHLSADGSRLYVAVSGSPRMGPGADPERALDLKADKSADGIVIVDTRDGKILKKLSVGSDPEEFALSKDGKSVYVSNEDEASLSAWDVELGRLMFRTKVSDEPEGVAIHPNRSQIFVTCEEDGDVFVVNADDGTVKGRATVGGRPRTVAFSQDGTFAFVPIEGRAEVAVLRTEGLQVEERIKIEEVGAMPMGAIMSPSGAHLFVSTGRGNGVAVIDCKTRTVLSTTPVGKRPWGIAQNSAGSEIYSANGASNDVSVIDVASSRERARIPVGEGPWGIVVAPESPTAR